MTSGYVKAARTVTCPYCMQLRSTDNLHQTTPRIKCKPCYDSRPKRGKRT